MFVDPGPVAEPEGQECLAGQTDKEWGDGSGTRQASTVLALCSGGETLGFLPSARAQRPASPCSTGFEGC